MENQQLIIIYGYVYQTTCLANNKKYIGQHVGIFDDQYHGSGTLLLRAINKYGKSNFCTQLICYASNKEELSMLERFYIAINNAVESSQYYNITSGGETFPGGHVSKEHRLHLSRIAKKQYENGRIVHNKGIKLNEEWRRNISKNHADVSGERNPNYGKTMSREQREKISQTRKMKKLGCGENNPMYGKRGKDNPNYGRKNSPETIQKMRNNSIKGKKLMNNGKQVKMVSPLDIDKFKSEGWVLGKIM